MTITSCLFFPFFVFLLTDILITINPTFSSPSVFILNSKCSFSFGSYIKVPATPPPWRLRKNGLQALGIKEFFELWNIIHSFKKLNKLRKRISILHNSNVMYLWELITDCEGWKICNDDTMNWCSFRSSMGTFQHTPLPPFSNLRIQVIEWNQCTATFQRKTEN